MNLRPGENLQEVVRAIEMATKGHSNLEIHSPKRLRDKDTGRLREHDVVLEYKIARHEFITAIECRDRSRKVGVPEVEAFKVKCDKTGVHRGIIVSSLGFARTAIKKALALDISCFNMVDVTAFNWVQTPGIHHIQRRFVGGFNVHLEVSADKKLNIMGLEPDKIKIFNEIGEECGETFYNNLANAAVSQLQEKLVESGEADGREIPWSVTLNDPECFFVVGANSDMIPLTKFSMYIVFTLQSWISEFDFKQYANAENDKILYSAAVANVDMENILGQLVISDDGGARRITWVPKNAT